MKKALLFYSLFIIHYSLLSQEFSVLTCSRGEMIYSTFGHSAIRYQDTSQGIDWVYNYGLFNFHDPNFIPKFCIGKLDYMVGKESMNSFMGQYVYQQREVREQILNLSKSQKDSLLKFLEWNILPENKYYRYDFLFNNCATKIIDVLEQNCDGLKFEFYKDPEPKSFRELIHINAENTVPWIDWGMDLGLGNRTDRPATSREYCFLPEFVSKSMSLSNNEKLKEPLVLKEHVLIEGSFNSESKSFFEKPLFIAVVIFGLSILSLFYDRKWLRIVLGIFFIILSIGGLVIGFEWFFTEHSVTKANWNLGWLNPLSMIYGIGLIFNKHWNWVKGLVVLGLFVAFCGWVFGLQNFQTPSKILIIAAILLASLDIVNKRFKA